jgi:hypothetical protein
MDGKAGRLVDHQQLGVFIEDADRGHRWLPP